MNDTKAQHTPGPWISTAGGHRIVDSKSELVTMIESYRSAEEEKANACLIAAAPELLKALRAVAALWARRDMVQARELPLVPTIEAAIAKAEKGES